MDLIAPVTRNVIAPAWAVWERSDYLRHYRQLLRTQYDSPGAVAARQWAAAKRILDHAYRRTTFWRERLDAVDLTPDDIRSPDGFRQIPLLTKADLRTQFGSMLASGYSTKQLLRKRTSGSTGIAVEVLVDDEALQHQRACTLRADEWSGWRRGERVAQLWGDPGSLHRGWRGRLRRALLDRATYLDTLAIDEQSLTRFAESLEQRPPSLLLGHAHSLYLFAKFLSEHRPPRWRPRGIISAAMVLHDWERQEIERVFNCPVTNRYGCEEVSLIACQCERHCGLHINSDGVYVEILRADGSPAAPGEAGAVVVTDLTNQAMPILRYQIGDMAVLASEPCACGRGLPLLERVEGRIADYVTTPSGQLVSGISLTDHFATLVPGVVQLQIVQERVDRFVFRIVADERFDDQSRRMIAQLVDARFGHGVQFECELVDRIPQEPSGKYRFCISKVENTFSRLSHSGDPAARASLDNQMPAAMTTS
jgi:phenylacetate-CoA ligase